MRTVQANFTLPENIVKDLHKEVARGQMSHVVAEGIRLALKRRRLEKSLQAAMGLWQDHPAFVSEDTEAYVRKMRRCTRRTR